MNQQKSVGIAGAPRQRDTPTVSAEEAKTTAAARNIETNSKDESPGVVFHDV